MTVYRQSDFIRLLKDPIIWKSEDYTKYYRIPQPIPQPKLSRYSSRDSAGTNPPGVGSSGPYDYARSAKGEGKGTGKDEQPNRNIFPHIYLKHQKVRKALVDLPESITPATFIGKGGVREESTYES
jgi:hypothetical protein